MPDIYFPASSPKVKMKLRRRALQARPDAALLLLRLQLAEARWSGKPDENLTKPGTLRNRKRANGEEQRVKTRAVASTDVKSRSTMADADYSSPDVGITLQKPLPWRGKIDPRSLLIDCTRTQITHVKDTFDSRATIASPKSIPHSRRRPAMLAQQSI
jgi:hypothetical protein